MWHALLDRTTAVRGGWRELALGAAMLAAGCGAGPAPPGYGETEHGDILIASTAAGGGALAADYDFSEPVEVSESAVLEGFTIFTAADPGIMQLDADEPDEGFFVLADGVTVSMEITALTSGVSFLFAGERLSEAGDSVVLGMTPELHGHGQWQLVVPEGEDPGAPHTLSFKLTTPAARYAESEEYTVTLAPTEAEAE